MQSRRVEKPRQKKVEKENLKSFYKKTTRQEEEAIEEDEEEIEEDQEEIELKEEEEEIKENEEKEQESIDEFTQARQEALLEIDPKVYNPHPDESERLKCQHAYLSLLDQLKSNRKNILSDAKNTRLNQILKESDELYKSVKRPVDSVLDSKLLVASADLGHLRLKNIPSLVEASFSADDLAEGLKRKFPTGHEEGELLDFVAMGERLMQSQIWKGVHVLQRQLLALQTPRYLQEQQQSAQEGESQTTRKRKHKVIDPETEQEVAQELKESTGEKETFDFVRQVFDILVEAGGRCNYYKFILDPTSFARSVENMFYVAFLVKEDRLKIHHPQGEGEEHWEVAVLEDDADLQTDKRQLIMDLTMEKWSHLCRKLSLSSPLINF
jgi:hypothetical protein